MSLIGVMFGPMPPQGDTEGEVKGLVVSCGMSYTPNVQDGTAHIHVGWKTHESTERLAKYSRALCSMCPSMTREEAEDECCKYTAYEKRVIRENATRRPSKSLRLWLYRNRILIVAGLLLVAFLILHWILR